MCVLLVCTGILGKFVLKKMCICLYVVIETFSFFIKVIMPILLHLLDNIKRRAIYIGDAT